MNKLLLPWKGSTVVRAALLSVLSAGLEKIVVVTGHEAERVRRAVGDLPVRFAHNPSFAEGMGRSLAVGVRACEEDSLGFLVSLADMPQIGAQDLRAQLQCFEGAGPNAIVVPCYGGMDGHPVLFDRAYRSDLEALAGDRGARGVIEAHEGEVIRIPSGIGCVLDVDTDAELRNQERG